MYEDQRPAAGSLRRPATACARPSSPPYLGRAAAALRSFWFGGRNRRAAWPAGCMTGRLRDRRAAWPARRMSRRRHVRPYLRPGGLRWV